MDREEMIEILEQLIRDPETNATAKCTADVQNGEIVTAPRDCDCDDPATCPKCLPERGVLPPGWWQ